MCVKCVKCKREIKMEKFCWIPFNFFLLLLIKNFLFYLFICYHFILLCALNKQFYWIFLLSIYFQLFFLLKEWEVCKCFRLIFAFSIGSFIFFFFVFSSQKNNVRERERKKSVFRTCLIYICLLIVNNILRANMRKKATILTLNIDSSSSCLFIVNK